MDTTQCFLKYSVKNDAKDQRNERTDSIWFFVFFYFGREDRPEPVVAHWYRQISAR
jgi:hypothetical protein